MANKEQQKPIEKKDLPALGIILLTPFFMILSEYNKKDFIISDLIFLGIPLSLILLTYLGFVFDAFGIKIKFKKKNRDFKIQKSLNNIKLKSPNGEYGPYLYFTFGFENDLQNKSSKIPFASSFNNEARIYIENKNIGIGLGTRTNLSGENQNFVDIINTFTYLKTRIYLQEFSIITNFDSNKILVNFKKDNIWKTQTISTSNFEVIEEKEEQLSVFFELVYNNTNKTYHKINYINNSGFKIGDEISKFNGYEIIEKNNNCIVLKQNNKENKSEIKVFGYENITESKILENSGVIGINNNIFVENGNYYILVFTDVNFFNYCYYTNSDYKKSLKFLDKIIEKESNYKFLTDELKTFFKTLLLTSSILLIILLLISILLFVSELSSNLEVDLITNFFRFINSELLNNTLIYLGISFILILFTNVLIFNIKSNKLRVFLNTFCILGPGIILYLNN